LDAGFIDHLYTPLGTTSNYGTTANLHTLQITRAPAKLFPACYVLTSRSLATALTVEILQHPVLRSFCYSLPCRTLVNSPLLPTISLPSLFNYLLMPIQETLNYLRRAQLSTANSQLTDSQLTWDPQYIASGRTQRKTLFPNNPSIVVCVFVVAGTCLTNRCLAMNV
jgi:hypothetical protein